ncbi:MAG: Rieske (2Fe-2S) protein [Streptosporangiaceae bacterium]
MKVVVARLRDFKPGERRIVEAGRRSIGVFRVGDRFYAINNRCPHQGGPLCLGRTLPWVLSDGPGEFNLADGDVLLACPWHGWEYDLATGQSFLGPGEAPVRGYEVSVESGDALDTGPEVERHGRVPGPYVAETFPVRVAAENEEEYVVVDTRSNTRERQPGRTRGNA